MGLPGVAPHVRDETRLVLGAGLETAVAMKHLVHESSPARLERPPLIRVKIRANGVEGARPSGSFGCYRVELRERDTRVDVIDAFRRGA